MPTDLVREQDFILRVRRLQRLGTPHLVINLVLTALPAVINNRGLLEAVQDKIKEFAKAAKAEYAEMSNGDAFLTWEQPGDVQGLVKRLIATLPAEGLESLALESFMLAYHMPRDYAALRERTNHYVEVVRSGHAILADTPAEVLKSEGARGPLTAWSVDQIGKLLEDIDVRTYARTQPIYRIDEQDKWHQIAEEYFFSFDALRRERFPKLDIITPEHLFFALCERMDQRLLAVLTELPAIIAKRTLYLNLSVASVIGNVFTNFTHAIAPDQRKLLTFELHRGDLFQDFARTLNAIEVLHNEGFSVALDSVTPDMLPYMNLSAFKLDKIKINVSGDRLAQLDDAAVRKALIHLPADKLIFFRCDSDKAFLTGRELGIKLFQGWHIDDLAGKPAKR